MAWQERTHTRVPIQVGSAWFQPITVLPGAGGPHLDSLNYSQTLLPHPLISPHHSNLPAICPALPPKHLPPAGYPDLPWKSSPTKTDSVCPELKEARWQSKWKLAEGLCLSAFPFCLVSAFWAVLAACDSTGRERVPCLPQREALCTVMGDWYKDVGGLSWAPGDEGKVSPSFPRLISVTGKCWSDQLGPGVG